MAGSGKVLPKPPIAHHLDSAIHHWRICMKKSVRQRIEEFARMIRAIQDLSLAQMRRRRDDGLAEYEIVINGVIPEISWLGVGGSVKRWFASQRSKRSPLHF